MKHRGEIIEKAVRESGVSITKIAKQFHRSRQWVYNVFETSDLSLDIILEFGKILHYDFSDEIPQLASSTSSTNYAKSSSENEHTIGYWKDKYYNLLEEYNTLLKSVVKHNL
ncbi:MAG TPA: hypothetical protein PLI97_07810 [Fluviicola sp.]|nr:hypothetical protein [Fluviicola sp.]